MRRIRRIKALLLALTVSTGILATAAPALAAPAATARLTAGAQVFPGSGQTYSIQVTNSATPLIGETINAVRILLPAQTAGVKNGAAAIAGPGTWTAARVSSGNLQSILFKGGTIAPGGNATFSFPADVATPAATDKSGLFQVQLSSNGGQDSADATVPTNATLTTAVKILEVTSLVPTTPGGVADGSGTAGQAITMVTTVKNHALNSVVVDPQLTPSGTGSDETVTDQGPAGVAGLGGTSTFEFPVTLGTTGTSDRTAIFTAGAAATGANAVQKSTNMVVQVAPTLTLQANTLSPTNVRPTGSSPVEYTFTINAQKAGTPGLNLTGGTLTFAGTTANLQGNSFIPGAETKMLSFGPAAVTGADGTYNAVLNLTGTDANGKPFSQSTTLTNAITIDSILPVVTAVLGLPNDEDGDAQTAAKNGDTIKVTGSVSDNRSAVIDFVELRSNTGDVISVPVTLSGGNYTGSAPAAFSPSATSFLAAAQVTDTAGNRGTVESTPLPVDASTPTILNPGDVLNTTTIQVQFAETAGMVKGGCNPTEWKVDGSVVTDVRFSDGTSCRRTTGPSVGPDNYRLLVLAQAIDSDAEPTVTYTPGQRIVGDRAKDGAGNFTATTIIDTISHIAPVAPDILAVNRNGGTEAATLDGGKYWTRFGGSDLTVNFAGARSGYRIQVLDGNDNVLFTSNELASTTGTVAVPIGTSQGDYERKLRLLNARAIPGPTTPLVVSLDTFAPSVASSAVTLASDTAADQVTVTFSEPLGGGTNFSFDWYAFENAAGERSYYVVDRVTGSGNTRTVEAKLPNVSAADSSSFGGVDYVFTSGDSAGIRYVDRAGNELGDTAAF